MSPILATCTPWRGCSSKFPQPLSPKDEKEAQNLVDVIKQVNSHELKGQNLVYRSDEKEKDVLRQVFRWDLAHYDGIFEHGFQAHRRRGVPDKTYYSLYSYVNKCGKNASRPLDSTKASSFGFISTTVSNSWIPPVPCDQTVEVYRYEIYAPGGIWTSLSLGDKCERKFKRLDEVAFAAGIAPQYIRSAQLFRLTGYPDGTTEVERVDNILLINANFNPQSHPLRFLNIENPISYYTQDKAPLVQRICHKSPSNNQNIMDWYARDVADLNVYLSAAFRSSQHNEAYYILRNWCTLLNYDPGGTHDFVVAGPSSLSLTFRSLEYTPFGEHGIDGAFQLHGDEVVVFSSNLCALVNYAPQTKNDKIIKGPMTIVEMFPFFENTVFENGIDSACELKNVAYEAYVFKGNVCAHINYGDQPKLIEIGQMRQIIPPLAKTVFEGIGRIDAAYASHAENEVAYFFLYNNYGQINVEDGKEYLVDVWVMGANAPVIASFCPQKNQGIDMRDHPGPLPNPDDYDHDDL